MSIGGLPTSDLISIRGFAGIRGREVADLLVDMDAELPGLRGATRADKGMSSESLSESDEVSELSSFAALGDKGDGEDFSEAKRHVSNKNVISNLYACLMMQQKCLQ